MIIWKLSSVFNIIGFGTSLLLKFGGNYMESELLVSVVVVTYNSEEYILETLESIRNQTYRNIELIVSDDASADHTLVLVKKWIDINKERFYKSEIVQSESNTGVTGNCNRGIMSTTGEYIKLIAGDDLLLNNCVEDLLVYSLKNNLDFTYAKVIPFIDSCDKIYEERLVKHEKLMYEIFDLDVKHQYRKLLKGFSMYTIGLFLKRQFIIDIGGFDEEYKMLEDYPFAIKVTSMGYKLNLLNKYVAKYRVRSPKRDVKFLSSKRKKNHVSDISRFEIRELLPRMKKERMYVSIYDLYIRRLAERIDNLSSNMICSYLSRTIGYLSFSKIVLKIRIIRLENKK